MSCLLPHSARCTEYKGHALTVPLCSFREREQDPDISFVCKRGVLC